MSTLDKVLKVLDKKSKTQNNVIVLLTFRVKKSTLRDSFSGNDEIKRWPFSIYPTSVLGLRWKFANILASENWTP